MICLRHRNKLRTSNTPFRACKRCRPDLPPRATRRAEVVAAACRAIEQAEEPPTLAQLAATADMSLYHFQRVFKAVAGVTPKAYAAEQRAARVRQRLTHAPSVTAVVYDAGFNSNSRFYDRATRSLGMQPAQFRAGGRGETIRFALGECSLGAILVAATVRGICAITLGDDPAVLLRELEEHFDQAQLIGGDQAFEHWVATVVGLIEHPARGLDLPLDLRGTAFQAQVWQALAAIPPGSTASYAEIAARIGAPRAMRAVARACAANPVAVAIPCHRVVRRDGALSGYRWGVERKRVLLARERSL